jgi:plastocyanin
MTVLLRRAGIDVDLVEARPDWNVRGSGITLQGNALRVLREVGVWDEVREHGFAFDSLGLTTPDGTVLHVGDVLRIVNDDSVPHNIMSMSKGNEFNLGSLAPGSSVDVTFKEAGNVAVICAIHPRMKMTVKVLD